jgi:GT2 family glycosyltransferase
MRARLHVLMTVHDRKQLTLRCLERLAAQAREVSAEAIVEVVLVDDGSRDGTAAEVRRRFPEVHVIEGSGDLYWNGGMRRALEVAMEDDPDFCLFLNDDTVLREGALRNLLATHARLTGEGRGPCLVVGSAVDPVTGRLCYGGWRWGGALRRGKLRLVEPGPEPRRCDTMHGNCVLVPREVWRRIGNLDPAFRHAMGDLDYGRRAVRAGCSLWVAPGHLAECVDNPGKGLWVERGISGREIWRRLLGPKGLPPSSWLVFTSRHFGPLWPAYFAAPYLKAGWRALRVSLSRRRPTPASPR